MAYSPVQLLSTPLEDYAAWWLKFYDEGTTTLLSMATDSTGGTLIAKAEISSGGTVPIGFIKTAGNALLNPYINGDYDAWLFPTAAEADANDTTNAIQLADNLNADPNNFLVGQFEAWSSSVPAGGYDIDDIVYATDANYYISLVNSNLNFEPSVSPTQWQLIPVKDMVGLTEAQTLTNKTLTAPVLTNPAINDSNGNEAIIIGATASAVNEVTITNSATGNAPTIAPTGTDTDIGINITPKGTGAIVTSGIKQGSVTAGITADVGQVQGGSPLTSEINEVSTCANNGDSVTLPAAVGGQKVTIINNGANTCAVFPASGDDIGAGVNTKVNLLAATNITYADYDATNWESI